MTARYHLYTASDNVRLRLRYIVSWKDHLSGGLRLVYSLANELVRTMEDCSGMELEPQRLIQIQFLEANRQLRYLPVVTLTKDPSRLLQRLCESH